MMKHLLMINIPGLLQKAMNEAQVCIVHVNTCWNQTVSEFTLQKLK